MQVNINEYMIEDILDGKILAEIERHFVLNKSEHSFQKLALTFSTTVLSFKIARLERQSIISKLSENYRTDIFTDDMEPEFGFAKNTEPWTIGARHLLYITEVKLILIFL